MVCLSSALFAQEFNAKSITNSYRLVSEQNYEYEIIVTVPPYYDESKNYKTLYYLDAWWLEDIVKGSYTLLNRTKSVEEIILVGISIDGSSDAFTKQRTRDYTPTPYAMNFPFTIPLESGSLKVDATNSGDSDAFKVFLKDKVFPFVLSKYAVAENKRGFIGHSFGGLFGMYDAMDREPLFDRHIIISPALWWNKSELLYEKINDTLRTNKISANVFLCYGASETMSIVRSTNNLVEYFKANRMDDLKYRFEIYEKENHTSLLPESIYDGIEYFYKK